MDAGILGRAPGPFPLRFLGFGLFWAWLFLAGVSSSPLFGPMECVLGMPFELVQVSLRAVALGCVIVVSGVLPRGVGIRVLICLGLVAGTLTSPALLLAGSGPVGATVGAALSAIADTSLFLLWLSFFGYMRLGDALAMLVLSYATGALLFLGICALGRTALVVASVALPFCSCVAFVLSARLHGSLTGDGFLERAAAGDVVPASGARAKDARVMRRMTACLALYAFVFAVHCALSEPGLSSSSLTFAVEPTCMVLLAGVYLLLVRRGQGATYLLYRAVAPLVGLGTAMGAVGMDDAASFVPLCLGYLSFEVLALNDYCNIVHAGRAALLRSMAVARLAISAGMAAGWLVVFAMPVAVAPGLRVSLLLVVIVASTIVLTDSDVQAMSIVADDRAVAEEPDLRLSRAQATQMFVERTSFAARGRGAWLPGGGTHVHLHCRQTLCCGVHRARPCAQHLPEGGRELAHGAA